MTGSRITFREGQAAQPAALDRIAARLGDLELTATRPVFTGIGASYAASAVPVELLRSGGVVAQRVLANEIADAPRGFDVDLLIGVSQSGRSTETLAAFEQLRDVRRAAVVNVAPSPLGDLADHTVGLANEPDSFASTVGFTGTVIALDMIAGAIIGRAADPWSGIGARVAAVRGDAAVVIGDIADRVASSRVADYVAAGASRASAEEGALLLREVARIPSAASATRNYLHGEMESAGETLHVIFGDDREVQLAHSLSDAGHLTLLVTARPVETAEHLAVLRLPEVPPSVRVVLETVVTQELAGALADVRGIPIETFVFANNDTKQGGMDPAHFAASPAATNAG